MRVYQSFLSLLLFFVSAVCCVAQTAQIKRHVVLFGKKENSPVGRPIMVSGVGVMRFSSGLVSDVIKILEADITLTGSNPNTLCWRVVSMAV